MAEITLWLWRVTKPNARWRGTLRWRMPEDYASEWAAAEGVELERIEGSAEVRRPGGPPTDSASWDALMRKREPGGGDE